MTPTALNTEARAVLADQLRGTIETRMFDAAGIEWRTQDDGSVELNLLASASETDYPMGSFHERFATGAWQRSLAQTPPVPVKLLVNHEGLPLASHPRSLTLRESPRGLEARALVDPSDPDVDRVLRKVKRGDLSGASVAFRCVRDSWNADRTHRTIHEANIAGGDVSICTYGANDAAYVSARSAAAAQSEALRLHVRTLVRPSERERLALLQLGRAA